MQPEKVSDRWAHDYTKVPSFYTKKWSSQSRRNHHLPREGGKEHVGGQKGRRVGLRRQGGAH